MAVLLDLIIPHDDRNNKPSVGFLHGVRLHLLRRVRAAAPTGWPRVRAEWKGAALERPAILER